MRRFPWLGRHDQSPLGEDSPEPSGESVPLDDTGLAARDPGLAYDARFQWVTRSTSADLALVPELPNPMARTYALMAAALEIGDWEFVLEVSQRQGTSASHQQHAIWSSLFPEPKVAALTAVWMGAQSAFTLVILGACLRNEERAASSGDRATFRRWAALQQWVSEGGAGIINQGAGHLATRPYSSARTLEAAMEPMAAVLPFAAYGDMRLQGLLE